VGEGEKMTGEFLGKEILASVLTAWFLAQILIKIIVTSYKKKKLFLRAGVMGGGMPSGHAALVAALSTAVGLSEGFYSPIFLVALAFSAILIYQVLLEKRVIVRFFNEIVKEHPKKHILEELGHDIMEVVVGVAIGIVVVLAFYYY
jgi:acid phosphatase family membrane protein YuiD